MKTIRSIKRKTQKKMKRTSSSSKPRGRKASTTGMADVLDDDNVFIGIVKGMAEGVRSIGTSVFEKNFDSPVETFLFKWIPAAVFAYFIYYVLINTIGAPEGQLNLRCVRVAGYVIGGNRYDYTCTVPYHLINGNTQSNIRIEPTGQIGLIVHNFQTLYRIFTGTWQLIAIAGAVYLYRSDKVLLRRLGAYLGFDQNPGIESRSLKKSLNNTATSIQNARNRQRNSRKKVETSDESSSDSSSDEETSNEQSATEQSSSDDSSDDDSSSSD